MRWFDGGGSGPTKSLTTFGVAALLLAVLTLAGLEICIEYGARQREVAAGIERAEPGRPTGAEVSPTPYEGGGEAVREHRVRSASAPSVAE